MNLIRKTTAVAIGLVWLALPLAAQQKPPESGEYRVGIGDVIDVAVFQGDEISGEFPVESSGAITYPLLGTVFVAGMTVPEVTNLLEKLLEKDYYVDVQLQVEVENYHSKPVTVLGEVARPGTYYLEGQTSLHKILAEAGGLIEDDRAVGDLIEVIEAAQERRLRQAEGPAWRLWSDGCRISKVKVRGGRDEFRDYSSDNCRRMRRRPQRGVNGTRWDRRRRSTCFRGR